MNIFEELKEFDKSKHNSILTWATIVGPKDKAFARINDYVVIDENTIIVVYNQYYTAKLPYTDELKGKDLDWWKTAKLVADLVTRKVYINDILIPVKLN